MQPICSKRPDSAAWYAVFTKPRQEDRAADNLKAWDIPILAPKIKDPGKASRLRPLFPCYIFACFDIRTMLHKIRFTRGISYIVSFGGRPVEVNEEIITTIISRSNGHGIVTSARRLQPGEPVFIQSGPLRDFYGVFEEELSDSERVRILLTTVSYTARIELDKCEIAVLRQDKIAS